MVCSKYNATPVIQFDVEVELTKEETIKLLPKPYGVSFKGLENFFRTVFVLTDFSGLILRFDMRFLSKRKKDFYAWMIKKGGRIIIDS